MTDKQLAAAVLRALSHSSVANELHYFYEVVKRDLKITDLDMDRVYGFDLLAEIMESSESEPPRYYKGVKITNEKYTNISSTVLPLPFPCHLLPPSPKKMTNEPTFIPLDTIKKIEPSIQKELIPVDIYTEKETTQTNPSFESDTFSVNYSSLPRTIAASSLETQDSISSKNNDPSAKSLRKLLRKYGVEKDTIKQFDFNTTTYEKALIVKGNTISHKKLFISLGGKWNKKIDGWIFSKRKLIENMHSFP